MLLNVGWNRTTEEDQLSWLGRVARTWLRSKLMGASLALWRIPPVSALQLPGDVSVCAKAGTVGLHLYARLLEGFIAQPHLLLVTH